MARPKTGATESKKQEYGIWLGIPELARQEGERTQKEFSIKMGISEKTLIKWRKLPEVQAIAQSAIKILAGNEALAIMNKIIEGAMKGSTQDKRLYSDIMGWTGTKRAEAPKAGAFTVTFETDEKND